MELIIRLLNLVPMRPTILYVCASSHGVWTGGARNIHDEVAVEQMEIATYYGIPYVSAIDGFGPFTTTELQAWFLEEYRCDGCCHITRTAHGLISGAIILWMTEVASRTGSKTSRHQMTLPAAKILDEADIARFVMAEPLFIDTTHTPPDNQDGQWSITEDVARKPGLICTIVGAKAEYVFEHGQHSWSGVLHVTHLKSYEHMGCIEINVTCRGRTVGIKSWDTMWTEHISEAVFETVTFAPEECTGSSITLALRVVESTPPRAENKVKLFALTLY